MAQQVYNANPQVVPAPQPQAPQIQPTSNNRSLAIGLILFIIACILGLFAVGVFRSLYGEEWANWQNRGKVETVEVDEEVASQQKVLEDLQETNARLSAQIDANEAAAEEVDEPAEEVTYRNIPQECLTTEKFWDGIYCLDTLEGKFTLTPSSQVSEFSVIWGTLPEVSMAFVTPVRCEVDGGRTCVFRVNKSFSIPPEFEGGQALGSNLFLR